MCDDKETQRGSCMGSSPSVAEYNWAILPDMGGKEVRVRVRVKAFWAKRGSNKWQIFPATKAERLHCGILCAAFLKQFYLLWCVWSGVLHCKGYIRNGLNIKRSSIFRHVVGGDITNAISHLTLSVITIILHIAFLIEGLFLNVSWTYTTYVKCPSGLQDFLWTPSKTIPTVHGTNFRAETIVHFGCAGTTLLTSQVRGPQRNWRTAQK